MPPAMAMPVLAPFPLVMVVAVTLVAEMFAADTFPVALILPVTSSFSLGAVVPIPVLPVRAPIKKRLVTTLL